MDDHSNEKMENDKQMKQLEYNEIKMQKEFKGQSKENNS